ncbi:hypothetical protein COU37_01800 [Candidatus Micrarchaeota archaeon CG10_big_fil_rev_8_21_14_0_10_45_29]|nr:MAG: hypothetical protein COU37_01800 [Candidatus Micrarchaeota archaeon CG10_big_fil_rev_8_21_14_0_10_45_29]
MAKKAKKAPKRKKSVASKPKKKKNKPSKKPIKSKKAKKRKEALSHMAKKKPIKKPAKKAIKKAAKKKMPKTKAKSAKRQEKPAAAPAFTPSTRPPSVSRAVRESLEAIKSDLSEGEDIKIHREVEIKKPPLVLDKVYLQSMSFEMASMRQALDRIGRQLDKLERELNAHRNGGED